MSSADKTLMYPEGRCNLSQLGFDQKTQTIDELVTGDYVRDFSTVIEFIDYEDDPAILNSIAEKFNNAMFNKHGWTMVLYKSRLVYQFIFIDPGNSSSMQIQYHKETGWTTLMPLAGYDQASLSSPFNYVGCRLYVSGFVKYLRIAGYISQQFTKDTSYTLANIPEGEWNSLYRPGIGSYYQTTIVTSDGKTATIEITDQRQIKFTPRSDTLPKNTGINANLVYI